GRTCSFGGPLFANDVNPPRRFRQTVLSRPQEFSEASRLTLAAREVSRRNRGRRRAPRERSARTGSGERSRPHPAEPIAGGPKAQIPPAARSDGQLARLAGF